MITQNLDMFLHALRSCYKQLKSSANTPDGSEGVATRKIRAIRAIRVQEKQIIRFNYSTTNLTNLTSIHTSLRSYFPIRRPALAQRVRRSV